MKYPFIYISSLLRTGSTLLQEMLTKCPYSFIFHEPQFGLNKYKNPEVNNQGLKSYKINLSKLIKNCNLKSLFETFKDSNIQIGVKEIRNSGWKNYNTYFSDIKYILTGRDPHDIYISAYNVLQRSKSWKPSFLPFCPEGLYKELESDIERQFEIFKTKDCIKVKYEDLCSNPECFNKIKIFVKSPISDIGDIGAFHSKVPRGKYEINTHHNSLTTKVINRWEHEKSPELIQQANHFFKLMVDYNSFWNY
ncbi:MAG: sulfotransferase domain-containing protein [Patescibacteria group bacterium]